MVAKSPNPTGPTLLQWIQTEVSLRDLQKGPNFGGAEERKADGTLMHHITWDSPSEHCSLFPHHPILKILVSILQPHSTLLYYIHLSAKHNAFSE